MVHGVGDRRLAHQHRREAPLQRRVLLDVLAVLVVGGRADAGELAAGQRRLELVGGVLRPLAGGAGAHDGVDLVDEDDHPPAGPPHLLLDAEELLRERAAQLRAGHHAGHVELDQDPVAPRAGRGAQPLGDPLDDGGLADAGLAHQQRVVGAPLAEDVDGLLDLALAADQRVELAGARRARSGSARAARARGSPSGSRACGERRGLGAVAAAGRLGAAASSGTRQAPSRPGAAVTRPRSGPAPLSSGRLGSRAQLGVAAWCRASRSRPRLRRSERGERAGGRRCGGSGGPTFTGCSSRRRRGIRAVK